MARIEIVLAKLPALIADRTDSLKLETAIRYVGDIIFDASQNRSGGKAKALARVLSAPSSPEQAQSREAILTLFRDGYLDRYAEYIAWRDIGLAAGTSSDLAQISPSNQESATVVTPKVVVLTRMLDAPPMQARAYESNRIKSIESLESNAPPATNIAPAWSLKTPTGTASNRPAREWFEHGFHGSKESYGGGLTRQAGFGGEARDRSQGATASLEIASLEGPYRNPIEFARKYNETPAGHLLAKGFPCLLGFLPQISADQGSVEWANPVTGDSFRDHGNRLTSGSPGRLAIRAMLELARADNWASVAVKGSLRLQAFAEASAAELDQLVPTSPPGVTAGQSSYQIPQFSSAGSKRRRLGRVVGLLASLFILVEIGFGVAYIYSSPDTQRRLGIKSFIDSLQSKHEEALPAAKRENPLEFSQLTLALSTRRGSPLAPPQSEFKDTDLLNTRYLRWTASFKTSLAGAEGRDEKIEARFFDPNGVQIASSDAFLLIEPAQKDAKCTGVALMPPMLDKPAGTYRVALYSGDKMITQEGFIVAHDLRAKNAAAAAATPAAREVPAGPTAKSNEYEPDLEARKLAMIADARAKPLQLRDISFFNTTKTGTALSAATNSFDVSKVLFVGWQVSFDNRLYKLEPGQYRVDAAYIGPDGRTLGSVNDFQPVSPSMKTVTFSGRVGNSRGGAFLPGTYTVNFYLNGQYFGAKRFEVVASAAGSGAVIGSSMGGGSSSSGSMLGPTVATGTISGLRSGGNPEMELRLIPKPNGYLNGDLVIHQSGYGTTPIDGFVRGTSMNFQVAYGSETYYFEGQRHDGRISGTFESQPSGERGTWNAQAN